MTKLQYLNTYLTERLMTTAEDILQVIRQTIHEFQEEISLTKSENQYLRRQLAAQSTDTRGGGGQAPHQTVWVRVVPPAHDKQPCELDKSPGVVREDPQPQPPPQSPPQPPQIKEERKLRACRKEGKPQETPANTAGNSDLSACVYGPTDNGRTPPQQPDQTPPHVNAEECDFQVTDQFKTETQQEEYGESKTLSIYEPEPLAPVGAQCSRTHSECAERVLPNQRDWDEEEDLIAAHSNSGPQSAECMESFTSQQQYLTYHMQSLNDKLGSSLCNICGKTFSSLGKLKEHQRLHTGERPYCCEFCGKRFNQNCNLKVHVRVHTGEKPYPCPVCGKGFSQSSQVKMHLRTHR